MPQYENINMFGYLGAGGGGGGGGEVLKNKTGPILVYIYFFFILIYMNTNYEQIMSLFSGSWWALT